MRLAGTADMAVEADDLVGGGHDHVQIMADHQDAAAALITNGLDEFVERQLACVVHTGDGLVQH